ncbi:MAG TPA: DUF3187 family protein [Spirochaetota bacterium]|nr:DUF3187 family protein [Spirochaetota bacterium]HOM38157.1 DUF3187 family protein [Spirochaetota bacterium]HPQ48625.1 DUF3187 family protein [Spirochaetota bacterium]
MKKLFFTLFLILLLDTSYSESFLDPLKIKNQYIFYLPYLFMQNETKFDNKNLFQFNLFKSNTFLSYGAMNSRGIIDLETTYTEIEYIYYILPNLKIKISFPFIYDSGGYLDPIIEGFHHAVSLPNGGRDTWYNNKIYVWFEEKNLLIDKSCYGFSNPSIFISNEIISINPYISFTIGIKPGIIDNLIVSTKTWDIGNFLSFNYFFNDLFLYSGTGIVFMIGNDFFKNNFYRKKNFIFNYSIGGGLKIYENTAFIFGLYIQTSPYKTGIKRIDRISIINSYGFRFNISKNTILQFNIDEDSFTFAGTDISFNISMEIKL